MDERSGWTSILPFVCGIVGDEAVSIAHVCPSATARHWAQTASSSNAYGDSRLSCSEGKVDGFLAVD